MCVIAIKPKDVRISFHTLEDMHYANPDGAGLAIVGPDTTEVLKGFFNLDTFWHIIEHLQTESLVIHFRLATHGTINEELTHPFIIDKDPLAASVLEAITKRPVIFHNGIISGYGEESDKQSDTLHFVTSTLAYLPHFAARRPLLHLTGCKYTLIHKGRIRTIGKFEKFKGLYVSNTHFDPLPPVTKWSTRAAKLPLREILSSNFHWQEDTPVLTRPPRRTKAGCYCLDPANCAERCFDETYQTFYRAIEKED